jgi:hypothetical protein
MFADYVEPTNRAFFWFGARRRMGALDDIGADINRPSSMKQVTPP